VSELISSAERRKDLLKHLILQLHRGQAPAQVRSELVRLLGEVPYGEVVEAEQELIAGGVPAEEVLKLCDVHAEALQGVVSIGGAKKPPPGHPAHTFARENDALDWELQLLEKAYGALAALPDGADASGPLAEVRGRFNALSDVEKHYLRKENLLFPYLEKHGITGPPKVMWGKHDETRALLRAAHLALGGAAGVSAGAARAMLEGALRPASAAVAGMIDKERRILLPMCLDTLLEEEWVEIARQEPEIGFCLYDPPAWRPAGEAAAAAEGPAPGGRIRLPTGSFSPEELHAVLSAIPFDLTFVDRDDKVRYFTQGKERIFARNRAILGREVQYCHPPSSVAVVERILGGFKAGTHDQAAFWIELKGRFIHIEYFALRGEQGQYLGCLEVSQDLTAKRALTGEQRLLSWEGAPPKPAHAAPAPAAAPPQGSAPAPVHDHSGGHDHLPASAAGSERPAWAAAAAVVATIDARPTLAAGGHPIAEVLAALQRLGPGEVLELLTPFVPGPLHERAQAMGFRAASAADGPALVRTWFAKA